MTTRGNGPSLDPSWSVDNARLRARTVLRAVPPPEDDQLTWRFAVHMVANDSLVMADEIDRLREGLRQLRRNCVLSGAWDEGSWADNHVRDLLGEETP